MNGILKFLNGVAAVICFFETLAEIFLIPVILLVIGLLNELPWQYYAVAIGGYFGFAVLLQIILHFIFKKIGKRVETAFSRLLARMSQKDSDTGL